MSEGTKVTEIKFSVAQKRQELWLESFCKRMGTEPPVSGEKYSSAIEKVMTAITILENKTSVKPDESQRRRLLRRMAGNIAAGFAHGTEISDLTVERVAEMSVRIAERIIAVTEEEPRA